MAGMLKKDPGTAAVQQPAGGEESSNVTPEEQAQYDQFVTNGMMLMYEEKGLPQLLQTIAGDGNPIEGIANALVSIVTRLDDSSQKSGAEISGEVKYQGGVELMEQLVALAEQAGIHEYSEDDMGAALNLALDTYRAAKQQSGELPVDQLSKEFEALLAAEESGELEQVLPGINEYAKNAKKPEDVLNKSRKRA